MKEEKIYLPKDESSNLFKIRTSDNSIIIFLNYFGYPSLHLTFYIKELSEDERLFDIHLTDEKNNKKIYQTHIQINILETEKKIQERLFELTEDFTNLIKGHKEKSIEKNNLLCLNCFVEDQQKIPERLNDKNYALEFYSGIFNKTIEFDKEKVKECHNCENSLHNTFVDDKFTSMYFKNNLGLFTFKDQVDFSNELVKIIKEKFKGEFNQFNKIINELKIKCEEHKNGFQKK